jgi:transcription factor WhiB
MVWRAAMMGDNEPQTLLRKKWGWQQWALCSGYPIDVFFPEAVRGRELRRREERAKRICRDCPVLRQCREHALRVPEPYGIWGALSPWDRERVLRRCAAPPQRSENRTLRPERGATAAT